MEKCSEAANKYGRRKRHEKDGHTVKVKRNQLHVTRDLDSRKKVYVNVYIQTLLCYRT
jgi:hypothetical protein